MMSKKRRWCKLRFIFNGEEGKIELLKLLKEKQPLTRDEIEEIIMQQIIEYKEFPECYSASIMFIIIKLLQDNLIEGKWRKEGKGMKKEYSLLNI